MDQIKTQNTEYPSVVSLHVCECEWHEREVIVVVCYLLNTALLIIVRRKGMGIGVILVWLSVCKWAFPLITAM